MSQIDKLKDRILGEYREKSKGIENDALAKKSKTVASAELKAEGILNDIKPRAEKDGNDKKERMIARAQLESRNMVLFAKQEAINKVLNTVIEKVQYMSNAEYTDLIERLLLDNIETGNEEVIFSENDRNRIAPDLLQRVNQKLRSEEKRGDLKLSDEKRNISLGFILKREGLEVNCSIEAQVRSLRDSLQGEIASLLFS